MLTFKPPIGTRVFYCSGPSRQDELYLITGYNETIATIVSLDTGSETAIIMQFQVHDEVVYNSLLTVAD